jgi:rhamnopyranosyl-N-acetylglucosaminyl-diphospho-decaprenol beta-1,3/1,4-galactofuranosyltransferase
MSIAAVVMTHERPASALQTVAAILEQDLRVDAVIVVDGGSSEPTYRRLRAECPPAVEILRFDENIGPAAGRGAGLAWARDNGFDFTWFVDDDSRPKRDALKRLYEAAVAAPELAMIGLQGGVVRCGVIRHGGVRQALDSRHRTRLSRVDFVLLDGALIRSSLATSIGLPRADFFIMMEDVEYPLRARRSGCGIGMIHGDLMEWGHAGSDPSKSSVAWRGYYQARNHLRTALDLPMPSLLIGLFVRELHYLAVHCRRRHGSAIALRWRGLWDGALGRMGRRVLPPAVVPRGQGDCAVRGVTR